MKFKLEQLFTEADIVYLDGRQMTGFSIHRALDEDCTSYKHRTESGAEYDLDWSQEVEVNQDTTNVKVITMDDEEIEVSFEVTRPLTVEDIGRNSND